VLGVWGYERFVSFVLYETIDAPIDAPGLIASSNFKDGGANTYQKLNVPKAYRQIYCFTSSHLAIIWFQLGVTL